MKHRLLVRGTFRLLREHHPARLALILVLTLITGLSAGFSVVLLIPLLQLAGAGNGEPATGIALHISNLAESTGIGLTIGTLLLTYLVLLTVMPLLTHWKVLLDASYRQVLIYSVRRRLFRKIISADWSQLNRKSKTSHLQILTREVPALANYFYFLLKMIMELIITASWLVWAMLISAKFTAFIMAAGLLLFIFLRSFLHRAFRLGEKSVKSYGHLLKYIDDFWQTVKIAKVHSSEDFYFTKFDEASTSLLQLEYEAQKNHSLPQLIYRISGVAVLAGVVWAGYSSGEIPLTSFFVLIVLFARIFPQFVSFSSHVNHLLSTLPSAEIVMQLDGELPDNPFRSSHHTERLPVDKEILLRDISFSWPGGEPLFGHLSESIPAKKITGIIGASGLGKTTLIDIIAGLEKPQEGTVSVDGRVLDDQLLPSWKQSIGYLPQDAFFIDGTLRENLVWDSREDISDARIREVLGQVNALHLTGRFAKGLDEPVVNYSFNFSGGERQRLALARVLLRKPRLLLLDEATSSLDHDNEQQIMEVIAGLKKQVTILFVTHRTSLLPWFDKIIRLKCQPQPHQLEIHHQKGTSPVLP